MRKIKKEYGKLLIQIRI
uniref:Uncharacterized protein n=1 Tax=Rhizophora mucronata TaxID=61149 RepID=A0A2P2PA73_RHIMU